MQVQTTLAAYDQVAHLEYASLTEQAIKLWQATTDLELRPGMTGRAEIRMEPLNR